MYYTAYEYDITQIDKCGAEIDIPGYFADTVCGIENFLFYRGRASGRTLIKYIVRKGEKTIETLTYRYEKRA